MAQHVALVESFSITMGQACQFTEDKCEGCCMHVPLSYFFDLL